MDDRKDVTVPLPATMDEAIESQLEYGDSKAGWIREAIRQRLEREQGADAKSTDGGTAAP